MPQTNPHARNSGRRERELEALHAIATKVAAASSIEVICKVAAYRVTRVLGYSGAAVLLLSGGGGGPSAVDGARSNGTLEETLELVANDGPVPDSLLARLGGPPGPLERQALRTRRPQVVPELSRVRAGNLQERDRFIREGFRSAAMVPIVAGRRVWGILGVVAGAPEMLDKRAVRVLADVCRTIGVALEKRRLLDMARRQVDDIRFFRDLSAWIAGTLDLDRLLTKVCRNLSRLLDVSQCKILLHDSETKCLYGVAATPASKRFLRDVRIPVSASRSLTARCFRTRRPLTSYDAANDRRVNPGLLKLFKETSLCAVPLLIRGEAIGAVVLGETRRLRRFSEDELARAQTVTNQAALAIENALRHRDAVAARDRAELLLDTVRDCSSSLALTDTMQRIARRTVAVTSANRCAIFVPDESVTRIAELIEHGTLRHQRPHLRALVGREIADFPLGRSLLSAKRAIVFQDIGAEGGLPLALARRLEVRAVIAVPVRARGQFLAAFAVAYPKSVTVVPPEEVSLIEGVASQVALAVENARAFEEIGRQRFALDLLTAQMIGAQEEERRRIARELHDGVSQTLTAVKFEMERLSRRGNVGDDIQRAAALLGDAIGEVRRLCMDLRPSQLDHLGLFATIQWFVKSFAERSGLDVEVDLPAAVPPLTPDIEINLYRIVQEALSNVVKHSGASHATVKARVRPRRLSFIVSDDGRGFDPRAVERRGPEERGMGLLTMGERAHLLGGDLRVRSRKGHGTRIEATVPLEASLPGAPAPVAARGALAEAR